MKRKEKWILVTLYFVEYFVFIIRQNPEIFCRYCFTLRNFITVRFQTAIKYCPLHTKCFGETNKSCCIIRKVKVSKTKTCCHLCCYCLQYTTLTVNRKSVKSCSCVGGIYCNELHLLPPTATKLGCVNFCN